TVINNNLCDSKWGWMGIDGDGSRLNGMTPLFSSSILRFGRGESVTTTVSNLAFVGDPSGGIVEVTRRDVDATAVRLQTTQMLVVYDVAGPSDVGIFLGLESKNECLGRGRRESPLEWKRQPPL
ncbi:hypothetical protein PENTCL1PPCAC_30718, partial [Pristionchus entomophagus]